MDKRLEIFKKTIDSATEIKNENGKIVVKNGPHIITATIDKDGNLKGLTSGREGLKMTDVKENYPELANQIFESIKIKETELSKDKKSLLKKAKEILSDKTKPSQSIQPNIKSDDLDR